MKTYRNVFFLFFGLAPLPAFCATELKSIFSEGTVNGNIRAYYNTREYDHRPDEAAFSLGGALRGETAEIGWAKLGVGYYTAQDLDTNSDDPAKVNNRLGSDLEVLGEAYIKIAKAGHGIVLGRQKIETPFANSGDAFMIPFTFEAFTYKAAIQKFTVEFDYINAIKNRNSDEFIDVGAWSTNRLGLTDVRNTSGTLNVGISYAGGPFKAETWLSRYAELFDSVYVRGDYTFAEFNGIKRFISLQYGSQRDAGDAWLGNVDSTLYGAQVGSGLGKITLTLGYNSVADQADAYNNGAFLSPFTFSTSPLFTNNMLETFENVDAGGASKFTFAYNPNSQWALKLSYASFDFDRVVDRDATDVDVTYSFANYWRGLSLRWRVEIVDSDAVTVEQTNMRFQTQFVF